MGFHGTPILNGIEPLTAPHGQTLAPGASVMFGGLSAYQELVLYTASDASNTVLEVQFYPPDDPNTIAALGIPGWSQTFTAPANVVGHWRIPISSGSVIIINHSTGVQLFSAYLTQFQHPTILQEPDSALPRVFTYAGALTAGGGVFLSTGDGLSPMLTMNGPCTISISPTVAVSAYLGAQFIGANGSTVQAPISPVFTAAAVFNDIAVPVVPTQLYVVSSTNVAAVTITVVVIPQNPG